MRYHIIINNEIHDIHKYKFKLYFKKYVIFKAKERYVGRRIPLRYGAKPEHAGYKK